MHGKFLTHAIYANGVTMDISGDFPNDIKWYGTDGWIFVSRDEQTTPTDPDGSSGKLQPLMASDPKILDSTIGSDEIHLYSANSSMKTGWRASVPGNDLRRLWRLGIGRARPACCIISR